MVVTKLIYIHCDVCQEPHSICPLENSTVAEIREEAKQNGYRRRNGKDYCPNCYDEIFGSANK